jgi:hypothetical protein
VDEKSYSSDFTLTEKPEGTWYLVAAFYSTGDSFHKEDNCLDLVAFVKHQRDAEFILRAIEADYKNFEETDDRGETCLKLILPESQLNVDIYVGTWKGHFEHLSAVEVKPLCQVARVEFSSSRRRRQR